MSDNEQDSGSPAGTNGATNPTGSNGQSDQHNSVDAAKVLAALEALDKKNAEMNAQLKALQGDKDRGVAKANKEVEELKRQLAEIKKLESAGLEPDAAVEEFQFRETVRQLRESLQQKTPVPAPAAGNSQSATDPAAQLMEAFDLANDAGALKIVQETADPKERVKKLTLYAANAGTRQPDPSAAPALQSQPRSGPPDQAQLRKEYDAAVKPLRGNIMAVSDLQAEYRKKGLLI